MARDYRMWVRFPWRTLMQALPAIAILALALVLALHLLEPRTFAVQTLVVPKSRATFLLERQRYVRQDNWIVRVREGRRWRTVFCWIPEENRLGKGEQPFLRIARGNTNIVALCVGTGVVWAYDLSSRTALPTEIMPDGAVPAAP